MIQPFCCIAVALLATLSLALLVARMRLLPLVYQYTPACCMLALSESFSTLALYDVGHHCYYPH